MKKHDDFSDALASDMNQALQSEEFEALFKKASPLTKKANKTCEKCGREECVCKDENKADDQNDAKDKDLEDETADANDASDVNDAEVAKNKGYSPKDDTSEGSADERKLASLISDLVKVSDSLDQIGLEKTASLSLSLVNAIIVEAKKKKSRDDEDKKSKKDDKFQKLKDMKAKKDADDKNDARDKADKAKAKDKAEKEKAKEKTDKEKAKEKADKEKAKAKADKEKAKK